VESKLYLRLVRISQLCWRLVEAVDHWLAIDPIYPYEWGCSQLPGVILI